MTASLTPALALAYLDQMSADIEAAIVLDARGEALAGPPALAAPARALLAAAKGAGAPGRGGDAPARFVTLVSARCPAGFALAARDGRHAIVAAAGPLALAELVLHDLEQLLRALGGGAAERVLEAAPAGSAEAVLSAVRDPA